ncbi:hypothetical protein [Paenibacillus kobensis]|uniref:hypothetical protein n=1 Tax=Paenibacillus kobensis TaxID=59841 RepID=UPI000FDA4C99|nr:hypothetical protein [Paenibacillus kobensis]
MIGVQVNESSLEKSSRNAITGEIYFQFHEVCFPEPNWNDFVVILLTWWNKSIRLLETASIGNKVNLYFMEGPYYVQGEKRDSENVSLSFIRRNKNNLCIMYSIETEISSLKKSIVSASNITLKEIRNKGWINEDVQELIKSLQTTPQ